MSVRRTGALVGRERLSKGPGAVAAEVTLTAGVLRSGDRRVPGPFTLLTGNRRQTLPSDADQKLSCASLMWVLRLASFKNFCKVAHRASPRRKRHGRLSKTGATLAATRGRNLGRGGWDGTASSSLSPAFAYKRLGRRTCRGTGRIRDRAFSLRVVRLGSVPIVTAT